MQDQVKMIGSAEVENQAPASDEVSEAKKREEQKEIEGLIKVAKALHCYF